MLRHDSSAQRRLLQAARDKSDLTVSSLRKQLQQEADKNRAMNQVHLATLVVHATYVVSSQSVTCQVHHATAIVISGMSCFAVPTSLSFVRSR